MRQKSFMNQSISIILFLALVLSGLAAKPVVGQPVLQVPLLTENTITQPDANSSVLFIENVGQFDQGGRFQVLGGNSRMWLTGDAIWITLLEKADTADNPSARILTGDSAPASPPAPRKGVNIKLSFNGANPQPNLESYNRLETKVSYFKGDDPSQWHKEVPVWGGVRYKNLYPGIDLEVSGENGQTIQRLVAHDGADISKVQLKLEGMDSMVLESGALRLSTSLGEYRYPLLQLTGVQAPLEQPVLLPGGLLRSPFATSAIGRQSEVYPLTGSADLIYSSYLGWFDEETGNNIAVDSRGAAYVTGVTKSLYFPTTPGAFDTSYNTNEDAFVAKLNPSGSSLEYATFLGGGSDETGRDIAVDESGAVYVTGFTQSTNYPTTTGAFSKKLYGLTDVFVTKLNPSGSALLYSTLLGGNNSEMGNAIAVDPGGAAYITGSTDSSDFPTKTGSYDTIFSGDADVFVLRLNASGTGLLYSTFLGGANFDRGYDIALDKSGSVYVAGVTDSTDFPTTIGAFDTKFHNITDVFVTKLNPAGSSLLYSTYLGGGNYDYCYGIAVDGSGAAYVVGYTTSPDFPTTSGAFDTSYNREMDAYIAKLNTSGSGLVYSTLLGGTSYDWATGIAVDNSGLAYVTGTTSSTDFPTTPGAFDTSFNHTQDAFVTKLNASGNGLLYSTDLGGNTLSENGYGLALDGHGVTYITGFTSSPDFPTTPGAFDTSYGEMGDVFVSKLNTGDLPCLGFSVTQPESGGSIRIINSADLTCPAGNYRQNTTINLQALTSDAARQAAWNGVDNKYPGNFASLMLNTERSVSASFTPKKEVILLVHGSLAASNWTDTCDSSSIAYHFSGDPGSTNDLDVNLSGYFDTLPATLQTKGYDVWIAHLSSGPDGTPGLDKNAQCLSGQIAKIQEAAQPNRLRVIAHSMGGLVSRACISQNFNGCRDSVDDQITLGSPHAGITWWSPKTAPNDLLPESMQIFNKTHPNQRTSSYVFMGGDGSSPYSTYYGSSTGDQVVSKTSSIGWTNEQGSTNPVNWDTNVKARLWTDNTQTNYFATGSPALGCIDWFLAGGTLPAACRQSATVQALGQAVPLFDAGNNSPSFENSLLAGESASHSLSVDSAGAVTFRLYSAGGDPLFSLTSPSALEIDAVYAAANPSIATYQAITGTGLPSNLYTYSLPNAEAGTWQMHISNNGSGTMTYSGLASQSSTITLVTATDATLYLPDELFAVTADLWDGSTAINNALLSAVITYADSSSETFTLSNRAAGHYAATHPIADIPGYADLSITATGTKDGKTYQRQRHQILRISSFATLLTNSFAEHPVDADGNGKYEALEIAVGVKLLAGNEVSLSGDLINNLGQKIAHTAIQQSLTAGTHNLSLVFSGDDIRANGKNGPFSLTNLSLTLPNLGTIASASIPSAWATSALKATDFAATCYSVTLSLEPVMSGIVLPNILPNCGASQYAAGTQVTFTPQAFDGMLFSSWDGDTIGTNSTKTITIDRDKLVVAKFVDRPPSVSAISLLDPNPSIASNLRFQVTFSENVIGVDANDFTLTTIGLNNFSIKTVAGSGSVYIVSANTGVGTGTLRLDVIDNDTILDSIRNPLGGTGTGNGAYTSGQKYTLDRNNTFLSSPAQAGWILETSENSNIGGPIMTNAFLQLGDDTANKQYRSILYFDTAGLPDNAIITNVMLKIRSAGVVGSNPLSTFGSLLVDIRTGYFGTSPNLQAMDFQAARSAPVGRFLPVSGAPGWYQLMLTSTQFIHINKNGPTQFRLRFTLDDNNDHSNTIIKFYSGKTVTANRPVLLVEYRLP